MAKLILFVLLALTAITVQADFMSQGRLRRIPRSPFPTESPLSPVFHTHQWSGFEKSSDGKRAGVFSGAAAAAGGSPQASGQAFSLASAASGDDGPVLGTGSQVKDVGQSDLPDKLESRFGGDDGPLLNQRQFQTGYTGDNRVNKFSSQKDSYQDQSDCQDENHEGGGLRESHYFYKKGGHADFVTGERSRGYGSGSQAQVQAHSAGSSYSGGYEGVENPAKITFAGQPPAMETGYQQKQFISQSSGYGGSGYQGRNGEFTSSAHAGASTSSNAIGNSGYAHGYRAVQGYGQSQRYNGQNLNAGADANSVASTGSNDVGNFVSSQGYNSGHEGYNSGRKGYNLGYEGSSSGREVYNSGRKDDNSGYEVSSSGHEQQGFNSEHQGYNSGHQGYNKGHSALNGALNLASQGVQMSQPSAGCSTCGKSSYALSNAKSKSGDAVAVSVGG